MEQPTQGLSREVPDAPALRSRLLVAALIGLTLTLFQWQYRVWSGANYAGDISRVLDMAEDLLARRDPYNHPYSWQSLPYPLPAALIGLPFVLLRVPRAWAAALFWGGSSALLAFAVTRRSYVRLLIFLALPYWHAFLTVQWAPLVAAAAFYPVLSFLVLVKPQIALPIVLTRLNRTAIAATALVAVASLLVAPYWPLEWMNTLGFHIGPDGFRIDNFHTVRYVPLLTLPGVFTLLALACLRDNDARLLLIASIMPHYGYDTFWLWIIPRQRSELMWTVALSWGVALMEGVRVLVASQSASQPGPVLAFLTNRPPGFYETACTYLPMVGVLLMRRRHGVGPWRETGAACGRLHVE